MKNAFRGSSLIAFVLIAGLAGCASTNSGEKTGAYGEDSVYVDDSWITTKIKSDMIADSDISARNIKVKTTKGVVRLTGTAATWSEANEAAEIAHGVKGVVAVENEIRIE